MNFAIVGCGFIGDKRASHLEPEGRLLIVADTDIGRAKSLAEKYDATATDDYRAAVNHPDIDVVIVATSHDQLVKVALAAVRAGKHVLLEKPGARSPGEISELQEAAESQGVQVHVGFNHRFHPAMVQAKTIIDSGALGPLYFIRGRYGHGGRLGYDKEWRANPQISGGGELLDQGAHLLDLSQWFLGKQFAEVSGQLATYYWDLPVEDNAFMTLSTDTGQIAHLHVSWTEWKNMFSMEITGRDAKLQIDGLGGSYGTEQLTFYQMKPEMGPPDTTLYEYPGLDHSWKVELMQFLQDIHERRPTEPSLTSTSQVLSVIEQLYQAHQVPWLKGIRKP
ncbi:MAG: Gfo/Idh/MocA family oxidoreductase [Halioglobus sp.]|nr:Gfo/Idh/MocA family oxidoreductase [Halioglobus sp.]